MLTARQLQVLKFIDDTIKARGTAPSYKEMADGLKLTSRASVHRTLDILVERGFVRRLRHKARAIEVVRMPARSLPVVEEVAAERMRQIVVEGFTPEHDAEHSNGELALAAAVYAAYHQLPVADRTEFANGMWPWDGWFKPKTRRQALIRAAALLVAEVERLDRLEAEFDRMAEDAA